MSKKSFIAVLVLSVLVTYGLTIVDMLLNKTKYEVGLPFGYAAFGFPSGETNVSLLLLNIIFWFFVIWLAWRGFKNLSKKKR